MQREHVQPIVQVCAKLVLINHRLEITIGGGNEADVGPDRPIATNPLEFLVLDRMEQLRLEFERHFPDLVEKERAL